MASGETVPRHQADEAQTGVGEDLYHEVRELGRCRIERVRDLALSRHQIDDPLQAEADSVISRDERQRREQIPASVPEGLKGEDDRAQPDEDEAEGNGLESGHEIEEQPEGGTD